MIGTMALYVARSGRDANRLLCSRVSRYWL
jgi:hypothetical protein